MGTRLSTVLFLLGLGFASPPALAFAETDFYAGLDAFKRGEYETAHAVWLALAQRGHPESQFRVARLYLEGKGVGADDVAAVKFYRLAAAQGHARAQSALGFMLHTGRGCEPDISEAIEWYTKAARQGRASAQYNLGQIYLGGEGVEPDSSVAARWLRLAADQGYIRALTALARLYEDGNGVQPDPSRAFKLNRRAAKNRDAEGEFQVGRMLAEGIGTAADMKKAVRYYERASNQGHAAARSALDRLYDTPTPAAGGTQAPPPPDPPDNTAEQAAPQKPVDTSPPAASESPQQHFERGRALMFGSGVPRDLNRAEDQFRLAAEAGHPEAAYRLGLLLCSGQDRGRKAYQQAYIWFARAAERGVADAAVWRDRVFEKLSERERAEVQALREP